MMLALLLESACRSLLLGASVWLLLRAARVRDAQTLTAIWTMVLGASVLMPVLTALTPLHIAVPLPLQKLGAAQISASGAAAPSPGFAWQDIVLGLYGLIALTWLLRLATGLVVMGKIYRQGVAVTGVWFDGLTVRSSAALDVPVTFGRAILLPQDYRDWPAAKFAAVMAHESSHIARGDFFILLLAGIHRALFWFNPFAWWLQARLSELAETASDDAAIRRLNDPAGYAEILLDVSLRARAPRAAVAMAKSPAIDWRIERILSGARPGPSVSLPLRLAVLAALVPVSLAFAGAQAAIAPLPAVARMPALIPAAAKPLVLPPAPVMSMPAMSAPTHRPARSAKAKAIKPAPDENEVTYNPRALLDDPEAAILPAFLSGVTSVPRSAD